MLTQRIATSLPRVFKRNIGIVAPALQTAKDPIQQLFLDKVRDYKSKSAGGKLVDATPEIERERKAELDRVAKQYGGASGASMSEFPQFKFPDPEVEISMPTAK